MKRSCGSRPAACVASSMLLQRSSATLQCSHFGLEALAFQRERSLVLEALLRATGRCDADGVTAYNCIAFLTPLASCDTACSGHRGRRGKKMPHRWAPAVPRRHRNSSVHVTRNARLTTAIQRRCGVEAAVGRTRRRLVVGINPGRGLRRPRLSRAPLGGSGPRITSRSDRSCSSGRRIMNHESAESLACRRGRRRPDRAPQQNAGAAHSSANHTHNRSPAARSMT